MRAFVAVRIDPKVIDKISRVIDQLKDHIQGLRWVRRENIHLTLKFLGEVEEFRIESIGRALHEAARPFSRFTINAKGLGVFPGVKRPQVLWVGVESEPLQSLASAIETGLERVGFTHDNRSFKPHLSIARWRQFRGSSAGVGDEIERWKDHDFGTSRVDELVLFQSVLRSEGAEHRPLQTIGLNS